MDREGSISIDFLRKVIDYDAESGTFVWKDDRNGAVKIGAAAGYTRHDGYLILILNQRSFLGHRVAWFYVYGKWPVGFIDHIDGDPSNNSISNLREATRSQNMMNMCLPPSNTSGVKGVSFYKAGRKWEAYITVNMKRRRLGYFFDFDEAVKARKKAETELFGQYARVV